MTYFTQSEAIKILNLSTVKELKDMLGISVDSSLKIKRKMSTNTYKGLLKMEDAFKNNAIPHTAIEKIIEMNAPKATKRAAKVTKTVEVKRVNLNDYMGTTATDSDGRDYEYNRTIAAAENFIDYTMCQPEAAELLAKNAMGCNVDRSEWLTMTEILDNLDNGSFLSSKAFGRLKGALSKRMNKQFAYIGTAGFGRDIWRRYGVEFKESMIDRTGTVLRFNPEMMPEILRTIGVVAKNVYDANPNHPVFEGKVWISFAEFTAKRSKYLAYGETLMNSEGEKLPEFNGCYIPQIGLITDAVRVHAIVGRRLMGR